jgi:hypothetical protein
MGVRHHPKETPTVAKRPKNPNEAERALPEVPTATGRKNTRTPVDCTIHPTEIKPRRKKGPALRRFKLYKDGMTVQDYINKGGLPWDIWYDTLYGYVELRNPDGSVFMRKDHVV